MCIARFLHPEYQNNNDNITELFFLPDALHARSAVIHAIRTDAL